jgi:hypothetical protein
MATGSRSTKDSLSGRVRNNPSNAAKQLMKEGSEKEIEVNNEGDRYKVGNGLPKLVISYLSDRVTKGIQKEEHNEWCKAFGL